MNIEQIKQRLEEIFSQDKVEVFDSRGTGDHFSIIVISDKFLNMPLLNRHKMIYSIFSDKIVTEIHAMQIQTYTCREWHDKK